MDNHILHRHWYFLILQQFITTARKQDPAENKGEDLLEIILHVHPVLLSPTNLSPELVKLMATYPVHRIRLTAVSPQLKPTVYQ